MGDGNELAQATTLVVANRIATMAIGATVSFISIRILTPAEQGFLFTFLSLSAAQVLFELGLNSLAIHQLSHATAGVALQPGQSNAAARSQAADVARYVEEYYVRRAVAYALALALAGAILFSRSAAADIVAWRVPWAAMVLASALGFGGTAYAVQLEAMGELRSVYRARTAASITTALVLILLTAVGARLVAYPLSLLATTLFFTAWARASARRLHASLGLVLPDRALGNWFGTSQRQMAVSALSGYFSTNSLTPYAFHFFGAEHAGRFGLTLSLFNAAAAVAMARTTAEAPRYAQLIARAEFQAFRRTSDRTTRVSALAGGALGALLCGIAGFANVALPTVARKLVSPSEVVYFALLVLANTLLSSLSTALRAFRTEELAPLSLLAAIVVVYCEAVLRFRPALCVLSLAAFNLFIFAPATFIILRRRVAAGDAR